MTLAFCQKFSLPKIWFTKLYSTILIENISLINIRDLINPMSSGIVADCCLIVASDFRFRFLLQLALPISPLIMDGFWCSRCLNDRIEVLHMMRLFAGGATTPLVVKIGTKQPWVKIEHSRDFDRDFALFRGQIWL